MAFKLSTGALAFGLLFAAAQAGAQTITFDDLPEGATLSDQYAGLGVTFSANALSGAGSSASLMPWATNTNMSIVLVAGADVGGLGGPTLVSGNLLHGFEGWFVENGDASFLMSFSMPVTSVSVTFAGVSTAGNARLLSATGETLAVDPVSTGQFVLTYSSATPFTSLVVAPGNYDDWVGVDNISITAVPEPGTYAMMAAGLGLLALRRRRG